MFDAPIPGESLTKPVGGMPMEHPPQFTDPNKALEYLLDKLTQPKHLTRTLVLLKAGAPVDTITRSILFKGVLEGLWTVDLAFLIAQVTMWQIETVAKMKGIKYKLRKPDISQKQFLSQFTDLADDTDTGTKAEPKPNAFKGFFNG